MNKRAWLLQLKYHRLNRVIVLNLNYNIIITLNPQCTEIVVISISTHIYNIEISFVVFLLVDCAIQNAWYFVVICWVVRIYFLVKS